MLDFSDPKRSTASPERSRVAANYSFELVNNNDVRTLSTVGVQSGDDVEGLLYVPTLPSTSPCINVSRPYIPTNATRLENLPSANYPYVAFAPWINVECTLSFLNAASPSSDAFLTYLLDNGTGMPPTLSSPVWTLNDGGSTWSQLKFPVYAIPGASGSTIMQNMALYSGNLSSAPNSNLLLEQFAPTDYARLYATFDTGSGNRYPTLWALLLIILGIIVLLVSITSLTMHYNQRRARNLLRRRILAGEVDLASLGLAKPPRMKQSDIDSLPQIIYTPSEEKPSSTVSDLSPPSKSAGPAMSSPRNYNQPACPICLENYVAGKTIVRTLPCYHIYHPACIDPHLLSRSSFCPVCKARVPSKQDRTASNGANPNCTELPVITNAMVRRERYMRFARERQAAQLNEDTPIPWFQRYLRRPLLLIRGRGLRARNSTSNTPATALTATVPTTSGIEMGAVASVRSAAAAAATPDAASTGPGNATEPTTTRATSQEMTSLHPPLEHMEGRREWARRRASALLHRQSVVQSDGDIDIEDEERQRVANLPRWRKVLGFVFPGLLN